MLPSDERAQLAGQVVRQVGVVQRGQRREVLGQVAGLKLEHLLRPPKVPQPVGAKVEE